MKELIGLLRATGSFSIFFLVIFCSIPEAVGGKDDEDYVVEQRGAAVLLEVDLTDIVGRYARL